MATCGLWVFAQVTVYEVDNKQVLPEEPLKSLNTAPKDLSGRLLYLASVHFPNEPGRKSFFVVRRVGQTQSKDVSYRIEIPITLPLIAFDSNFSQDGRYILFKAGWPYDDPGYYQIYLWDLQNKQLLNGPDESLLSYRWVQLSSDSNSIAYCRGGNNSGDERGANKTLPLELCIYDLKNRKKRSVAMNPAVKNSVWTQQGNLLFSLIDQKQWYQEAQLAPVTKSQEAVSEVQNEKRTARNPAARPNVYEIAPEENSPRLLIEDAYRPVPSPDGKWIACFTSTDEDRKIAPTGLFNLNVPVHSYLCLYDRIQKRRVILRPVRTQFPQLAWTPDSTRLIVVSQNYQDSTGTAIVESFSVQNPQAKMITKIVSSDFEPASRSQEDPQFQPLKTTNNGTHLLMVQSKYTDQGKVFINEIRTLLSINLTTGEVETVAEIANRQAGSLGLDWYDTSEPKNRIE